MVIELYRCTSSINKEILGGGLQLLPGGELLCSQNCLAHWPLATDHWPLITEHWSLTTDYWFLSTDHWFLTTDHWFLTTDHWKCSAHSPAGTPISTAVPFPTMLQHNTDVLLIQCIATYQFSITVLPLIVSLVPNGTMSLTSIFLSEGGVALELNTEAWGARLHTGCFQIHGFQM